jgi:hypothetical protein
MPPIPSGFSTLWLGPATKPPSDIEILKRSLDMSHLAREHGTRRRGASRAAILATEVRFDSPAVLDRLVPGEAHARRHELAPGDRADDVELPGRAAPRSRAPGNVRQFVGRSWLNIVKMGSLSCRERPPRM